MISTDRDFGRCGKGRAAEKQKDRPVFYFGRDDNIGATVTRRYIGC